MNRRRTPRIGLALGGGSARGWAHIGVIRALEEIGVQPSFVCGTSIGALVGAVYANGELDWLEDWVTRLSWQTAVRMLDLRFTGGLLGGQKLINFFGNRFGDKTIGELNLPFAAVATHLDTGREIWLQEGRVMDAVRASIAIPGLFMPVSRNGMWLVDGGLVNPVPVSVARALGSDIVIAVDLNNDILSARASIDILSAEETHPGPRNPFKSKLRALFDARRIAAGATVPLVRQAADAPSLFAAIEKGINIMQVRITRSRLAGEPADIWLTPRLGKMGLMDFHRGREAIEEGRAAVARMLPEIQAQIPSATR